MPFTEFYCNSNGSNLNAGSGTGAATATYAAGTFVRSTGVFTVASGDPTADGVAAGQFASIYTTSGASVAKFVARITACDATTITVSLTAMCGAVTDVSETASATTCIVGGAWAGPSGAVGFPFNFIANACQNASSHIPRVNFNGTFSITAAMSHTTPGPIYFQGYTSTAGDGGFATFDAQNNSINIILSQTGNQRWFENIKFYNSRATGIALHWQTSIVANKCIFHTLNIAIDSFGPAWVLNSEVYNCSGNYSSKLFCYYAHNVLVHGNAGGANTGNNILVLNSAYNCIVNSTTGTCGIAGPLIVNCDVYGLTSGYGYRSYDANNMGLFINCNAVNCGGYGFATTGKAGTLINCGSYNNTGGRTATLPTGWTDFNPVTYGSSPYVDPSTDNFALNIAAAIGAGFNSFPRNGTSQADLVGYLSIGAVAVGDYPTAANVRSGVTCANGTVAGTLVVPGTASGQATLALENSANARGGSGKCAKLTPSSTTNYGYWDFYVPVTAASTKASFYWAKSASGFNGTLKVSIWDSADPFNATPGKNASQTVDITAADTAYHLFESTAFTPSAAGLCRVRVEVLDGSTTGFLYIDDIGVGLA